MKHRNKYFAYLALILIAIGNSAYSTHGTEELNAAAHELYKSDVHGALKLFREAAVGDSPEAVDAFRMVGQTEFMLRHFDASIEAYRNGLAALDGWNSDNPYVSRLRVEFLGKLAQSLDSYADRITVSVRDADNLAVADPAERDARVARAREMREEAIDLRDQLFAMKDLRKLIRARSLETYMLKQVRELLKLKRNQEAQAMARRLEETFPQWGRDNGRIIQLRFDIVRAMDLDQVQYVRALEAIWYDPELQEFDQLAMIGNNIVVRYLANSRYDDVRRMNNEVLDFIEAHPRAASVAGVNVHAQQLLIKGAMLEADGEFVGARGIYEEVRSLYPDSKWSSAAQKKIDDLVGH